MALVTPSWVLAGLAAYGRREPTPDASSRDATADGVTRRHRLRARPPLTRVCPPFSRVRSAGLFEARRRHNDFCNCITTYEHYPELRVLAGRRPQSPSGLRGHAASPSRGNRRPRCEPCASHPGHPFAALPHLRGLVTKMRSSMRHPAELLTSRVGVAWTCAGRRTERRTCPLVRWRMAPRAGLRAHGATLTTFPSSAPFEHPLSPVHVVGRGGAPHRRRWTSLGRLLRATPRRLTRSGRPGCFPPCATQALGGSLLRANLRRPPAHAATRPRGERV